MDSISSSLFGTGGSGNSLTASLFGVNQKTNDGMAGLLSSAYIDQPAVIYDLKANLGEIAKYVDEDTLSMLQNNMNAISSLAPSDDNSNVNPIYSQINNTQATKAAISGIERPTDEIGMINLLV